MLCGIAALVFGVHAIVKRRLTIDDDGDDLQMWLRGWRSVAIGVAALILGGVLLASASDLLVPLR